jgi:hypothetical protein
LVMATWAAWVVVGDLSSCAGAADILSVGSEFTVGAGGWPGIRNFWAYSKAELESWGQLEDNLKGKVQIQRGF